MSYHLTLVRTTAVKVNKYSHLLECCQSQEILIIIREHGEKKTLGYCQWKCKLIQPLWKMAWRHLKKIKNISIIWTFDPTSNCLTKGNKIICQRYICTPMFTANYSQYIEYYSDIMKKVLLQFLTTWMNKQGGHHGKK